MVEERDEKRRQDDPWGPAEIPRPSGMRPDAEPPELPEPEISPPEVGGLDEIGPADQPPLAPPDLMLPLPGKENAPFPTGDGQAGQGSADGGMRELVAIGERIAEITEDMKGTLEEVSEKLDENASTFGP